MARPGNFAGLIPDTQRRTILEVPDNVVRVVRLLTVFNPTAVEITGVLQLIYTDDLLNEIRIRRWAIRAPSLDAYVYGSLGGILVLDHEKKFYEIVLDTLPTKPLEFAVDYADDP